jgi:hypothetical protein
VENGAENHTIGRLHKLNGPIGEGDVNAIADDLNVLCVRGLCWIHRRTGQCIPHTGCGGRSGSLRESAGRKKWSKSDQEEGSANHKDDPWYPARKYTVFASQASATA